MQTNDRIIIMLARNEIFPGKPKKIMISRSLYLLAFLADPDKQLLPLEKEDQPQFTKDSVIGDLWTPHMRLGDGRRQPNIMKIARRRLKRR